MERKKLKEVISSFPDINENLVNQELKKYLAGNNKKIVVLDDDPTGVQTVHGISVYTDWSKKSIEEGFDEENPMFYILTNSRSFTKDETIKAHREIAQNILDVSRKKHKGFIMISRSDSTLRGHYPLETEALKDTIEEYSNIKIDGEIIFPFFKEGGRYTVYNTHYVLEDDCLIPAGETEFARDKTFGYNESHLGKWIEYKSGGVYKADCVTYISLESIRSLDIDGISMRLIKVKDFNKVVVNALDYVDVKIFVIALLKAMKSGKNFVFRSAASLVKVIGGVSDKELLTRKELVRKNEKCGGLVIVGSHVKRTTRQLEKLLGLDNIVSMEFNVNAVYKNCAVEEINKIVDKTEEYIKNGRTAVIYTSRQLFKVSEEITEKNLELSVKVSEALVEIVKKLTTKPKFIIAKGGITSSSIGVKGLNVRKAVVLGQILPGIPVWRIGEESKFPGMAYIIFPGNVGDQDSFKDIVNLLM